MPVHQQVQRLPDSFVARSPRLGRRLSLFLRRTHLYVGLFVTPWLVMYALSTLVFNHADQVDRFYRMVHGPHSEEYFVESQSRYARVFPPGATLRTKAERILTDLNLNGSFGVEAEADRIVVTRRNPFVPRRITLNTNTRTLVIERQNSRLATLLTALHTQVTYANQLKRIKAWALSVDLTIATMLILVFSGISMWWELKATRPAGFLFLLAGVALFCLFLFVA